MESCLFCKIIAGVVPSEKIYEDDTILAFLDIHPVNIGHTLVIPKAHHATLYAMPDELLAHMLPVAKKIALGIKEGLAADGVNIAMNNEDAAGQIIHHAHIHVIPRYTGDGFAHWKGARGYTDGEMHDISEKIKAQI